MSIRKMVSDKLHNAYLPIESAQRRMGELIDSMFSDFQSAPALGIIQKFPALEVCESDKLVYIKAELPSVKADEVSITVQGDRIFISGQKKNIVQEDAKNYHMNEISYGRFARSVSLAFDVDPEKVKAAFENGLLVIEVEKPVEASSKPKKIHIQTK